jgi:hypothetical protein
MSNTVKFKKHVFISFLIFLGILLAFSPVFLAHNYIRQDDLMWEIWPWMKISDFGYLYHNTVFELFRPICMISFYITDLISIDITHATYVRLFGVILLGILANLLYRWQLLYNSNRALAASFALASFTLPAYQVFAATGNYSLILSALLMTFGAAFYWHASYHSSSPEKNKRYYRLGCLLFFASLLDYPLSSMYIWALMTICYLNTLTIPLQVKRSSNYKFILFVSWLSIKLMIAYYIACRLVHLIFHVNTQGNRVSVINFHQILNNLKQVYDVLGWHSNFWFWDNVTPFLHNPIVFIVPIFIFALFKNLKMVNTQPTHKPFQKISLVLFITLLFFFLSYSPILASPDFIITFRYALTTMPILLYTLFWSINILMGTLFLRHFYLNSASNFLSAFLFIATALFGLGYANLMLADGIVGPHQQDFDNIQKQLHDKVLPLLKDNKQVVIHAIACDQTPMQYGSNVPTQFEYGMRICQYQQQVIGVVIHSLRKMGYASNFNKHNEVIYKDNEIIVNNTPWGSLVVSSSDKTDKELAMYTENNRAIITIDARHLPTYQQFSFYKLLLG